jgi:hypothetical protein
MAIEWLFPIVVGCCIVWAYLIVTMSRRGSAESDRKALKARKFGSRLLHPHFRG